jgi:hypothetical protein
MQVETSHATQANDNADIFGAVRIGNGDKLHRAYQDQRFGLIICCGCAGTQSGSAYNRARWFAKTSASEDL